MRSRLCRLATVVVMVVLATTCYAQESFPEAVGKMEAMLSVDPQETVPEEALGKLDQVLQFLEGELRTREGAEPAAPDVAYSVGSCGYHIERRVEYYRGCFGRCRQRVVCVRVEDRPRGKMAPKYEPYSDTFSRLQALQNAVRDYGTDPNIDLHDLALQVYGLTLAIDTESAAGKIKR